MIHTTRWCRMVQGGYAGAGNPRADPLLGTAYLGILGNVVALGLFIPTIGIYLALLSVVFLWIWFILLAKSFFQFCRLA